MGAGINRASSESGVRLLGLAVELCLHYVWAFFLVTKLRHTPPKVQKMDNQEEAGRIL